jgi:hypothetical protein
VNKGLNAAISSAIMPFAMSMFFGVHFLMVVQIVNAPFVVWYEPVFKRLVWPFMPLGGGSEPGLEALFAKEADFLRADPSAVPISLQLVRRKLRSERLAAGKSVEGVAEEWDPPSKGVVGVAPTDAPRIADGSVAAEDEELDALKYVTYGEHYDEVMEDAIFGAWEDDEPLNVRAVEALKEGGKRVNYATDDDQWTFLMVACGTRSAPQRLVERLLELGCGPASAVDVSGQNCLHWAATHDCPQAVRGVARFLTGKSALNAADAAAQRDVDELERALNQLDRDERSPLDLAEAEGHDSVAAALKECLDALESKGGRGLVSSVD